MLEQAVYAGRNHTLSLAAALAVAAVYRRTGPGSRRRPRFARLVDRRARRRSGRRRLVRIKRRDDSNAPTPRAASSRPRRGPACPRCARAAACVVQYAVHGRPLGPGRRGRGRARPTTARATRCWSQPRTAARGFWSSEAAGRTRSAGRAPTNASRTTAATRNSTAAAIGPDGQAWFGGLDRTIFRADGVGTVTRGARLAGERPDSRQRVRDRARRAAEGDDWVAHRAAGRRPGRRRVGAGRSAAAGRTRSAGRAPTTASARPRSTRRSTARRSARTGRRGSAGWSARSSAPAMTAAVTRGATLPARGPILDNVFATAPDGRLWATTVKATRFAQVTAQGAVTLTTEALPACDARPKFVAFERAADGALWLPTSAATASCAARPPARGRRSRSATTSPRRSPRTRPAACGSPRATSSGMSTPAQR